MIQVPDGLRTPRADSVAASELPVIVVQKVTKFFDMGALRVHALKGISLAIRAGEFVAVRGASGSGKSTLMHILGALDTPSSGRYVLDGIDVQTLGESDLSEVRNAKIGFVFQSFNLLPRASALANVELPLVYAGIAKRTRRARAVDALKSVGLADRLDHLPSELSGGEQQRVALARAIVTDPAIILADEPTGNLDSEATIEVMELLRRLNAQGRTLIVITHEDEVAGYAGRIITLRDGLVIGDRINRARAKGNGRVATTAWGASA